MIHARDDYNRIQDPERRIPASEPVFLLRGQDIHAPNTLEFYAQSVEDVHGDPVIVAKVRAHAHRMRQWQEEVASKAPDLPPPPATLRSTILLYLKEERRGFPEGTLLTGAQEMRQRGSRGDDGQRYFIVPFPPVVRDVESPDVPETYTEILSAPNEVGIY